MPPHVSSTMCSSSGQKGSKFYYHVFIFIELYFSNFKPLTCFSVMIPDTV